MDLLGGVSERVHPVGRLDHDTSGLLLLTNDGEVAWEFSNPQNVVNTYIVKVIGTPSESQPRRLREGLYLREYKTNPAKVLILNANERYCTCEIALLEGRIRQVRRMFEFFGHKVVQLTRIAMNGLCMGDLPKGSYRYLNDEEIIDLKNKGGN